MTAKARPRPYPLAGKMAEIVTKVRMYAPPGLVERWGVVKFGGNPDFRLNLGRYRVIGVLPNKTYVGVYMEWTELYRRRTVYASDPDFTAFEDAHAFLQPRNQRGPWQARGETDLDDRYVDVFLETGMRLMVKKLRRKHPGLADTTRLRSSIAEPGVRRGGRAGLRSRRSRRGSRRRARAGPWRRSPGSRAWPSAFRAVP